MNTVRYRGETTNGLSPDIWHDCQILKMAQDPAYGYGFIDDFLDYSSTASGTLNKHGLPTFEGDCTMTGDDAAGGTLAIFGTSDNEEAGLEHGGGACAPFVIATSESSGKKLWFECRVKKSAITDSLGGFFVGLVSEGSIVADFIADAGNDFADVDLLGFWNDETDDSVGSHVHWVTQKTSAAFDTIYNTVATLVADTYIKLGFKYDPDWPDAKKIRAYVDGVEQTSYYVGQASGDATVYIEDTTNFPGGEEMTPGIAIKMASADDMTVTLDWWACYQER